MRQFEQWFLRFKEHATRTERFDFLSSSKQFQGEERWLLLKMLLEQGFIIESVTEFLCLKDPRTVCLLERTFQESAGSSEEQEALLGGLAAFEDLEFLCSVVDDPFLRPMLREYTLGLLSGFTSPRIVELFLSELKASEKQRKLRAIRYVAHWRVGSAVPKLGAALEKHHVTSLRASLLEALAQIASEEAGELLKSWFLKGRKEICFEIIDAFEKHQERSHLPLLESLASQSEGENLKLLHKVLEATKKRVNEKLSGHKVVWGNSLEDCLFDDI